MSSKTPEEKVEKPEKEETLPTDGADGAPKEPIVKPLFDREMQTSFETLTQSAASKEPRNITPVLRKISGLKAVIDLNLVAEYFKASRDLDPSFAEICDLFKSAIESHTEELPAVVSSRIVELQASAAPEIITFLCAVTCAFFTSIGKYNLILEPLSLLVQKLPQYNQKTMDGLSAKIIFTLSLVHEKLGTFASLRPLLMGHYRSSVIKHQPIQQATVMNCLLRSWVLDEQYDLAQNFVAMTSFPENLRSNALQSRYLFYTGCLDAVQLDYSKAVQNFTQVLRKLPSEGPRCIDFRIAAQKMAIITTLLMGETPARSVFSDHLMKKELLPYYKITKAVRKGNVAEFETILIKEKLTFQNDRTFLLVRRLQQSVIRSCLRTVSMSYSRISLKDVARKLNFSDSSEVEGILGKAIFDGVIDVVIDDEEKTLLSNKKGEVYSTQDPARAFHQRIAYCLQMYTEAVKALHYPAVDGVDNPKLTEEDMRRKEVQERINRDGSDDLGDDW